MSNPIPDRDRRSAAVDRVRRRLLIDSCRYVAPAVLASLAMSRTAYAQQSCNPPAHAMMMGPPDHSMMMGPPPGAMMMG